MTRAPLLAETPLAPVAMPEGVTGFGAAEIAFLAARHPGPITDRSVDILTLPAQFGGEVGRAAGASSLLARGLLAPSGEDWQTRDVAALVEYAIGTCSRWVRVDLVVPGRTDTVYALVADAVVAVLQPRALGTWFASISDRADRLAEVPLQVLRAAGPAADDAAGAKVRVAATDPDGQTRELFARTMTDGGYEVHLGPVDAGERSVTDEAGLRSLLDGLWPELVRP